MEQASEVAMFGLSFNPGEPFKNHMKKYDNLVKAAIEAMKHCYFPREDGLLFGSAVLTKSGKIFSSGYYRSDSYTLTLHAEQAALAVAAANGEKELVAIVTVNNAGKEFSTPCGLCRQLIWENSKHSRLDIDVILANQDGEYEVKKISELIPFPWP